jgi:hypothetical protein
MGEMPHLNNSKLVSKNYAYAVQRTKDYLFYCLTFQLDWIFVSKNDDKTMSFVVHI